MRVTVLGGYGNAGVEIVRLAGRFTGHSLVIAGRNAEQARSTASMLSHELGSIVESTKCDASLDRDVANLAESSDLVLVASSTIELTGPVATACLRTGTHYIDIGLSTSEKWTTLRSLEARIQNSELMFITDGGFHPGLPGVLIRWAATRLPDIETAFVAGSFALDWRKRSFSPSTETEFAQELNETELTSWMDGRWVTGYRHSREFDFGNPIGRIRCIPMMMQEMRDVVDSLPSLRNSGFFISGFGPVVDYLVMPACMAGMNMGRRMQHLSGRLFMWGLERFASSSERAIVRLEASAVSDDGTRKLILCVSHDDPYVLTAAPVVSCLRQLESGVARPGLHTQAGFVDPDQTLQDLREMGVAVDGAD